MQPRPPTRALASTPADTAASISATWRLAVTAPPSLTAEAEELAQRLSLTVTADPGQWDYILEWSTSPEGPHLALRHTGRQAPGAVAAEFVHGRIGFRRRHSGRRQALARALGLHKGRLPTVVDATAGLGRDGFILASLGCSVTLIERSPVVAALLANGLARASQHPATAAVCKRLTCQQGEAADILAKLSAAPAAVYLDPMHPVLKKRAQVKKEMRLLRAVVGSDEDASSLLRCALAKASQRVVVKLPRQAPALTGPPRHHQVAGTSTRFDIYLTAGHAP